MIANEHIARAGGCRRLWAAVLMIAIRDARRGSGNVQQSARRFLASDQAELIASRAGVRDARQRLDRILGIGTPVTRPPHHHDRPQMRPLASPEA